MTLGVILMPNGYVPGTWNTEIAQTRGGNGTFLQPFDPYYNQRGERGWYYDTQLGQMRRAGLLQRLFGGKQLGKIPTDAEVAKQYSCYTPVKAGWINAQEPNRYIPPPWRFGWDPAGPYGPQTSLSGSGPMGETTALDVLHAQTEHNRRIFMLTLVSTAAVATSALIAAYRSSRLLRRELAKRTR